MVPSRLAEGRSSVLCTSPKVARACARRAGSVAGPVCIWQGQGDWQHIKAMKGHSGIVNAIAVHPSGSVALSVSRDKQMRLWDLSKGACAYQAPLGAEGALVVFLQGGAQYAVATGAKVSLHSVKVRASVQAL
jgi:WD40 repeat protein